MRAKNAVLGLMALLGLAMAGMPAHAQRFEGHSAFHGDIGHFHEHDWAVWHGGHWEHSFHDGRWGWWWIAGGVWYFYPYPIYPYPDPYIPPVVTAPVTVEPAPPPAPQPTAWYYCASARGYYPYVPACPEGWRATAPNSPAPTVPAAPPPAPPAY